jgi:hypothetical protein
MAAPFILMLETCIYYMTHENQKLDQKFLINLKLHLVSRFLESFRGCFFISPALFLEKSQIVSGEIPYKCHGGLPAL